MVGAGSGGSPATGELGPVVEGADDLPTDADHPYLKYFGRWDTSPKAQATARWGAVYLEARFSGSSCVLRLQDEQLTVPGGVGTGDRLIRRRPRPLGSARCGLRPRLLRSVARLPAGLRHQRRVPSQPGGQREDRPTARCDHRRDDGLAFSQLSLSLAPPTLPKTDHEPLPLLHLLVRPFLRPLGLQQLHRLGSGRTAKATARAALEGKELAAAEPTQEVQAPRVPERRRCRMRPSTASIRV